MAGWSILTDDLGDYMPVLARRPVKISFQSLRDGFFARNNGFSHWRLTPLVVRAGLLLIQLPGPSLFYANQPKITRCLLLHPMLHQSSKLLHWGGDAPN